MRTQTRSKRRGIVAVLIVLQVVVLGAIVFVIAAPSVGRPSMGLDWGFIGTRVSETTKQDVPVAGDRANVRVTNPLGKIDVRGSTETSTVSIEAEKVGRGASAVWSENAMDDVRVDVRDRGADIDIEVAYPPMWFPFLRGITGDAVVNLTITVPRESDIDVDANMGEVTVAGVNGEIDIDANMGQVRMSDVSGDVTFEANMGEVTIRHVTGNLTGHSDMGSIDVRDAMLTELLKLTLNMGSVEFSGVPARRSELTSNMGSVKIAMPADRAFDVEAETSMGSVEIDMPFNGVRGRQYAHGTLGTGAPVGTLHLESEMGSIEIEQEGL